MSIWLEVSSGWMLIVRKHESLHTLRVPTSLHIPVVNLYILCLSMSYFKTIHISVHVNLFTTTCFPLILRSMQVQTWLLPSYSLTCPSSNPFLRDAEPLASPFRSSPVFCPYNPTQDSRGLRRSVVRRSLRMFLWDGRHTLGGGDNKSCNVFVCVSDDTW